jgi:hypothetical protein
MLLEGSNCLCSTGNMVVRGTQIGISERQAMQFGCFHITQAGRIVQKRLVQPHDPQPRSHA